MAPQLPNDFSQALTAARYEILKYLRGRKLLVFLLLTGLILVLLTAAPYLLGVDLPDDPRSFMTLYLSFGSILVILAATLFSADSLATEYEHRTGFLVFTQPMKREALFAGKFMASFAVSAVMISIFYLAVYLLSLAITGEVLNDGYTSLGLALLYVLAATGFGFLLSAFMSRATTAAILVFATLLLVFPIIDSVLMFSSVDPWFSITQAGESLYYVVTGQAGEVVPMPGFGDVYYSEVNTSAAVLAAWAALTSIIALLKFKTREL